MHPSCRIFLAVGSQNELIKQARTALHWHESLQFVDATLRTVGLFHEDRGVRVSLGDGARRCFDQGSARIVE
jgi:hypothetical protein